MAFCLVGVSPSHLNRLTQRSPPLPSQRTGWQPAARRPLRVVTAAATAAAVGVVLAFGGVRRAVLFGGPHSALKGFLGNPVARVRSGGVMGLGCYE